MSAWSSCVVRTHARVCVHVQRACFIYRLSSFQRWELVQHVILTNCSLCKGANCLLNHLINRVLYTDRCSKAFFSKIFKRLKYHPTQIRPKYNPEKRMVRRLKSKYKRNAWRLGEKLETHFDTVNVGPLTSCLAGNIFTDRHTQTTNPFTNNSCF